VQSVPISVVGIGADGWDGLAKPSRTSLKMADVILGGPRQLAMLPPSVPAERIELPSPLLPELREKIASLDDRRVAVLASGDPMFFGIGSTLVRMLGPGRLHVLPHPSSVSLAAARLGWPIDDVDVVSMVGRPLQGLYPAFQPGRRLFVLVSSADGAQRVRDFLHERGYGDSLTTVLAQLGGPLERVSVPNGEHDPLAIVAIECRADEGTLVLPRTPGLPDDAFEHDGQITKREIRALAVAALVPIPGQLLWDIGAGSGSVGIEWMRTHPSCHAIAIEPRADRRERVGRNADLLGVPGLEIVAGTAPEALVGLPKPDAVFVGGAVSVPGVLEACLDALDAGGRLVANAVTLETELVLSNWYALLGGSLTRVAVQRAEPVGGFTGWRPAMPVTQWAYRKPRAYSSSSEQLRGDA
jgi:precorrin-6Y C5,15-methyltransferase (decarboxylating)